MQNSKFIANIIYYILFTYIVFQSVNNVASSGSAFPLLRSK